MCTFQGFLVHAYADLRRDRLYFAGRLEDGRSFAVMESRWRPSFHIYQADLPRFEALSTALRYEVLPATLRPFGSGEGLALLRFPRFGDRAAALNILSGAGIPSPDGDIKPAEAFLAERFIRSFLAIRGVSRPGRLVDMVFPDPELEPVQGADAVLKIVSIDIETDTRSGSIRAVSCAFTGSRFDAIGGVARVLLPPGVDPGTISLHGESGNTDSDTVLVFHRDEASLLKAFVRDIQAGDPDVLTGWNFLDFDFPRLADRCEGLGVPFALGRSRDSAKFFAGEGRRSAAALVPGRQVIDALRIVRAGPRRFDPQSGGWGDFSLQSVAQAVLGEGKTVTVTGEKKIAQLDRLFHEDPRNFGHYCYQDAALVLRILAKTGLFRLTMERAGLTGVFLDKAWTSVVSFERVYGMELRRRGIAPGLPAPPGLQVSGAAGGTVLEPEPGLFSNIAVFDFRSLYPTIMLSFNIDPLAHALAEAETRNGKGGTENPAFISAPNGAVFSRTRGLLPELIEGYFAARRKALSAGDDNAAHVYKILMNSFYGVLGTGACRYGRTELAGAITSFARKWLLASRDWFTSRGRRVLYGDTDSLFVETGLDDGAGYEDFAALAGELAMELNRFLGEEIRREYGLESRMELRFEKAYRRFMIPPLRGLYGEGESRGRAKGYAGHVLHPAGGLSVEVKGMEAVRSDATPLARRLQLELLELVFSGSGETALRNRVFEVLRELRKGALDGELVYRKRLSRPPESYTSSTPPQVKAARALGWKGRRGTVEFVWAETGPEPASLPHGPYDYDHYADSQVLPVARSIAAAAGWNTEIFPQKGRNREAWQTMRARENGQLELDWH